MPANKKTLCLRGHPYAGDNLHVAPSGRRYCRACGRVRSAAYYARTHRSAA
ncbi:MAG: hypothetical protein ACR2K2_14825 [Mycobacteriales bacterium]